MHPCLTCGACCAMWPVQFPTSKVAPGGVTPRKWVVPANTSRHVCMKGTTGDEPRCAALDGVIGDRIRCSIYRQRPQPCHDVVASYERGERDYSCDEARKKHGLPRLTVRDWR